MKTVLCYGDSNTWGANPETGERFSIHQRWPGVLRDTLGGGYYVVEEGLCGRTTIWVDEVFQYRTGRDYLLPCLDTHAPIDLVVIMLGTNDLKARFHLPAEDIARGVSIIVEMVIKSHFGPDGTTPKVLLISPPVVVETPENQTQFADAELRSGQFSELYRMYANQLGVHFLDASEYVESSLEDGIHLDASAHEKLGRKIAEFAETILG